MMNKAYSRIVWENEPSEKTALSAQNLNKMDKAVDDIDDRVVEFDTTKANQTDLLTSLSNVTYNEQTGEFTFTWKNGNVLNVDLNIEKIPVNFSMSSEGVITMTNADGTKYTADVSSLIKTYGIASTSEFNVTSAVVNGVITFTLSLKNGGVTEDKLQPNFLADCRNAKSGSETSALQSEGYALGTQNGVDVPSSSPYYHNNAKYYSDKAGSTTLSSLTDTDIQNPANGQLLKYKSGKWENDSINASEILTQAGTTVENAITSANSKATDAETLATTATANITNMRTIISGTLGAGETSITLTDSRFVDGAIIDPWQYVDGEEVNVIAPTKWTVNNGSVTLFYDAQDTDVIVGVRCL